MRHFILAVRFLWGHPLRGQRAWLYGAVLRGNGSRVCRHQIFRGLLGTPADPFSVLHHCLAVLTVDVPNGVGGVGPVGILVLCAGMVPGRGLFGGPRETDDVRGAAAIRVTVVLRWDTTGVRKHDHTSPTTPK